MTNHLPAARGSFHFHCWCAGLSSANAITIANTVSPLFEMAADGWLVFALRRAPARSFGQPAAGRVFKEKSVARVFAANPFFIASSVLWFDGSARCGFRCDKMPIWSLNVTRRPKYFTCLLWFGHELLKLSGYLLHKRQLHCKTVFTRHEPRCQDDPH